YADGSFSRVDVANLGSVFAGSRRRLEGLEGNVGLRRSINLLAPGRNVTILDPDGRVRQDSGTSFAAPHVVGTVALIQEYGDRQLRNNDPQWTVDARRHEVTKAVLLNSADKVEDAGDGLRLGMTRTVMDKDNLNWLQSDAYKDETIPLHGQTGTGHLNAYRALQQFSLGQYAPNAAVPPIGWDYNTVGVGQSQEYALEKPLQEGSYVSVTLAWNRLVELEDANSNGMFEVTEEFRDRGLNDLNLYLVRADGSVAQVVRASISAEDSVEHIFFPVPETGRYTLRVTYAKQVHEPTQPYALAWWTVPAQ
ncbi:MAG: S8 family serine peptidase, partial [Coleofasciculaceae cyanobacterium SM2_3_26]|nr:S8 family serine peptidase [Coleofasciculaceae cyanobacterium SM2_3_26]